MRLVVADTSPVFYLHAINEIQLLPSLFGAVLLPEAVWMEIQPVADPADVELNSVGIGERTAIALATSIQADLVLIDERKGAGIARRRGLETMGTLGILDRAADRGLVDLPQALDRLQTTNSRYRREMLDALRAKHAR